MGTAGIIKTRDSSLIRSGNLTMLIILPLLSADVMTYYAIP